MQTIPIEDMPLLSGAFVNSVVNTDYDQSLILRIESATKKLLLSEGHPVMLLGKVQSGKTKAFLGIIAYAFDNGFDISIILTKGTRALAEQTFRRLQKTFAKLRADDLVRVYDIMRVPSELTVRDRRQKILLVVKKEDDNLRRLSEFLFTTYPDLGKKNILLIDDEADLASVGFKGSLKRGVTVTKISSMINELREKLPDTPLLQVTATPYALYLQPEADINTDGNFVFRPLRPAYTEIVPIHDRYVGGDTYFVRSEEPGSVESHMHVMVEEREFDALRKPDGRKLKLADVLTSKACAALRRAIIDFVIGASVRRLQQLEQGERPTKFSMIVHTEQARAAHLWQTQVAKKIVNELIILAVSGESQWVDLINAGYHRCLPALEASDSVVPVFETVLDTCRDLVEGVRVQKVNSDEDVLSMLGEDGQLELDSALTVFVGGQILDRGVTIEGLIAFYYGRNPKAFQQDTVLQHSRMYGARPFADLPVTRFYTSERLHGVMKKIHEFDHALRGALELGNDQGVAFIMEERGLIRSCAPNKVLLSKLTSLTPNKRLLPVGFQTKAPGIVAKRISRLDQQIAALDASGKEPIPVDLSNVLDILRETFSLLDLEHDDCVFDERAFLAAIDYLSRHSEDPLQRDKVLIFSRSNRLASRQFESGRFSNIPFSASDAATGNEYAIVLPCIMLLRQEGQVTEGWRGVPFWWPILQAPKVMRPVVFSAEVLSDQGDGR